MASFADAVAVTPVDSHTYSANFPADWCIGSVPHGGYVTSVVMHVAATHFRTTLQKQNQPHPVIAHMEFLRRTQAGPATFHVRDSKVGATMSNIHITLVQDGREEVEAYVVNSNLNQSLGPSFTTGWALHPPPPPVDLPKLRAGHDTHWKLQENPPFLEFRKASQKVQMYFPREGHPAKNIRDEWLRFTNGERFTQASLGYVSDVFPQMLEGFEDNNGVTRTYWYPTMVLNMDVKKCLPPEGAEWLFVRVQAKQVKKGRMDLDVIIMDEAGEIVALSHHVAGALDPSRNTAPRTKKQSEFSKI